MIADHQTNQVLVSDRLEIRYPELAENLEELLKVHGVSVGKVAATKDIWVRDFLPIQLDADGSFVSFTYNPDYVRSFASLVTGPEYRDSIAQIRRCQRSEIVLDGGNLVRWTDRAILTDKVFRENPGLEPSDILKRLRELLQVEDLTVIPVEPGDVLGHADGVVRFFDRDTVLVNRYSQVAPAYRKRLFTALRKGKKEIVEVPYRPREDSGRGIPPAFGCYTNFLQVRGLIVLPSYGIAEDDLAHRIVEDHYPGSTVCRLDCAGLSMEGGSIGCMTWNVLAREAGE